MSSLRKTDPVIAVACSDIHLSHRAPVARSAEPDWYLAMSRPLNEISDLLEKHNAALFIAGDIFDRWDSPPELINFAIDYLPKCHAVPGQHDLAHHNLSDIGKTSYATLRRAGTILTSYTELGKFKAWGFPWGTELKPCPQKPEPGYPLIAVIHRYCYDPGQPQTMISGVQHTRSEGIDWYSDKLRGFDVAVIGDNHRGFLTGGIFNCGTLMRRKFDEIDYKPQVGLIHASGKVTPHYLDCSKDKFADFTDLEKQQLVDLSDFLDGLRKAADATIDFREMLNRAMQDRGVSKSVRKIVLGAMDDAAE